VIACDAPMNSAGFFGEWSRCCHTHSYTEQIMTEQNATHGRLYRCRREGNSLLSRLALSEVQICGIPKLSLGEVAPTP
jgi:hypothetical protein